jgi:hypothetical protein
MLMTKSFKGGRHVEWMQAERKPDTSLQIERQKIGQLQIELQQIKLQQIGFERTERQNNALLKMGK